MINSALPQLQRGFPRWMLLLNQILMRGVFMPLAWLLARMGFGPKLVVAAHKAQLHEDGPTGVFRDYTPDAHDVFVCTYAKSGTNWMMQIAHQLAFDGDGDYAHIHDAVTWPDVSRKMRERLSVPLQDERVWRASPHQLRVIKTHLGAAHVPYDEKAHYLVVIRDPKEVFVSSYYFSMASFGPLLPTPDEWLELFLSERFPLSFGSTWAEHAAGYWAWRDRPGVLLLSYSDMKRDLAGSVRQVATCLGLTPTDEQLSMVVQKSSFDYMSTINDRFLPVPKGMLPWGDFNMMRAGKAGNSGELLSLAQQQRIDAHFRNALAALGSEFPYERFCRPA
jgi:hypothetical protein